MTRKKLKKMFSRRKRKLRSRKELNPVFKVINRSKRSLMLTGIRRMKTSGRDPTLLSIQLKKRNKRKALS